MNNDPTGFAKMVPGFDFLQSLVKNAGSAIPGMGQWVAPTLDPAELEKRIEELRTVQFWLEQNARMLAATIQALEVQRMTLSTLQTMNVQMGDLRESLKIKLPGDAAAPAAAASDPKKAKAGAGATAAVDPMQWWGALTNQFAQLATSAMKGSATDAAQAMAGGLVKQTLDAASAPARAVMDAVGKKAAETSASGDTAAARPAAKKAAPKRRRSPKTGAS